MSTASEQQSTEIEHESPQRTHFARTALRWTVPPGVSLVVHAGLIGTLAWIGMQINAHSPEDEQVSVVELALPSTPSNAQRSVPESNNFEDSVSQSSPSARSTDRPQQLSEIEREVARLGSINTTKPRMDPVALASTQAANAQIVQPQSAAPPTVQFAGVQSKAARKIVYVVDGSGATANSFAYLQAQLLRSIDRLSATQLFQVVIFRSYQDELFERAPIGRSKLARATTENKQLVAQWLEETNSRGRSNPLDGLRAAFELDPDLILLITRSIQRTEMGWAQGQQQILRELNTLNPADPISGKRSTRIQTIQLLDEDPTGIMRSIGTLHGDQAGDAANNYRVVTYDDLIAPDQTEDLSVRSFSASNEQRIESAGELLGSLASSGVNLSALHTYVDSEQLESITRTVKQVQSLLSPMIASKDSPQDQATHQEDGRATLLYTQSLALLASISDDFDQDRIRSVLNQLSDVIYNEPNTDAHRMLLISWFAQYLGDHDQARSILEELSSIAREVALDRTIHAHILVARISLNMESEALLDSYPSLLNKPPMITPSGSIDGIWGLIAREAITKARFNLNHTSPWDPMIELRNAASGNPGIQNYIDHRIKLIADRTPSAFSTNGINQNMGSDGAPTDVLLAIANVSSHSLDSREQSLDLYEQIAEHSQNPEHIAQALWQIGVLGRAINTRSANARSTIALTKLAERYPESPRALDALVGAISSTDPNDHTQLIHRLRLALDRYPDHIESDLWRLSLAEELEDFERLGILDQLTPLTREGVLGAELYERTVYSMLDRYDDPTLRAGLCERMSMTAQRFGLPSSALWTKRVALIKVEAQPQDALVILDQLIEDAQKNLQPSEELVLLRAMTLNRVGQTQLAFNSMSELIEQMDASGNHTSTYWQTWAELLEMITKKGTPDERVRARSHITRLKLIDQNLGGSPWKQRIIEAGKTLHSSS